MDFFKGDSDFKHDSIPGIGVLLVNLGTPEAPTTKALRPYLKEFLSDPRVIELPKWKWQIILRLFVLRKRPKQSAALYKKVWTKEGSPLLVTSENQRSKLEENLKQIISTPIKVSLGMRYGKPSISGALQELKKAGARQILVLPLYPQYSGPTTGSTFDAVADELKTWRWIPELRFITKYHDNPRYIEALVDSIRKVWQAGGKPERLIFSYHGIPERYFLGGDPYYCHCQKTSRLVAEQLGLNSGEYLTCFQSLFGKEEWIKPYTDVTLKSLVKSGVESVDVICPGFTADCLETLEEIDVENRKNFLEAGGKQFRYIPALNDSVPFNDLLTDLALENMKGWFDTDREKGFKSLAEAAKQSKILHDCLAANS